MKSNPSRRNASTNYLDTLRAELDAARTQLTERKLVERAKGIVMQRQNCTEEDAFRRMRKLAMEKGLKLSEVAQRILDTVGLL